MRSSEVLIKKDNIEICTDSFGSSSNPALLLIMGASASMIWWDEEFCARLADKGRFVIRYDNRDVGKSSYYEPGSTPYSVIDMVDDSIRVLDYYGISKAHYTGLSLGGMIAQLAAMIYPERVLSITMIASGIWDDLPGLPQIDKKIIAYHSRGSNVNWNDENSAVEYMAEGLKLLNGSRNKFNKEYAYKLAGEEFKRARNLVSMFNHAFLKGGEEYYGKAGSIKVPALVIHGTEDPVLPYPHAEMIISTIPGSKHIKLEGAGHEIHYNDWDTIIGGIIEHTK